jgi:hypothetical protein
VTARDRSIKMKAASSELATTAIASVAFLLDDKRVVSDSYDSAI